jgi:hypothetical protein
MVQTVGAANPLIKTIMVMYDNRAYDPTMVQWADGNEGPRINVFLGTEAGFDETNVEYVKVTHTRATDASVATYMLHKPTCNVPWVNTGERLWWVFLHSPGSQTGEWKFTVKSGATIENRILNVNYFLFPSTPANVSWQAAGSDVDIFWDAACGPPKGTDANYNAHYRILLYKNTCAGQETINYSGYDPLKNRVVARVPSAWRGTRIRIENILMDGGGQKTSANWGITSRVSRGTLELICP